MSFAKCRRESQHTAAQITSLEELLEGMAAGLAPVAKGIAVVFAHTVPCQYVMFLSVLVVTFRTKPLCFAAGPGGI